MVKLLLMKTWNLIWLRRLTVVTLLAGTVSACGYDRYLDETDRRVGPSPSGVSSDAASPPSYQGSASIKTSARNGIQPVRLDLGVGDPSLYYEKLSYRFVPVKAGDTLLKLADRYAVPVKSVIALNRSQPPFVIYVGQQIKIPLFKTHKVRRGESLYAISRVYDVDIGEIVHFNFLESPYILSPGAALRIPQKGGADVRVAAIGTAGWTGAGRTSAPQIATVPIKRIRNIGTRTLAAPTAQKPAASVPQKPVRVAALPIIRPVARPTIKPAAKPIVKPLTTAALPPVPRQRFSIKKPPQRAGRAFNWPVKGRIISGFGVKKTGFRNDGINIKVPAGTPIRAAENGVVSYVGNEMRSFGNLILVSHADGYVTTYGHVATMAVTKGQAVRKGDVIATVGATGEVSTPQLHFEVRKNGSAKNPMELLTRR